MFTLPGWKRAALVVALVAVGVTGRAEAQANRIPADIRAVSVDSGKVGNPGGEWVEVYKEVVGVAEAPWVRLIFDTVELEGESELWVRSLLDGEKQRLDKRTALEWQLTTAFFNGPMVEVSIIAAPGMTNNRVALSKVMAGTAWQSPTVDRAVCQLNDTRAPSADARTARLILVNLPVPGCPQGLPCNTTIDLTGCTGFIIDQALSDDANNRVMLSAGHCFDSSTGSPVTVAQFEPIPQSASDCTLRHPPVAKQFAVNVGRYRSESLGPFTGHDWAAFVCFANSNTGNTVFQEQGAAFPLAGAGPAQGAAVSKYGYGVQGRQNNPDAPPNRGPFCRCVGGDQYARFNQTQQTSGGVTTTAVQQDFFQHNMHTCPADSGSPVFDNANQIVGIHVGGFCGNEPAPPTNSATSTVAPHVATGIMQVATVAAPLNNQCAGATTVIDGQTAFSTIGATTDGPAAPNCAGDMMQVKNDVWFRYVATSASTLISTCTSGFDTRIAVYNNACPTTAVNVIACNDDSNICGTGSLQSAVTVATTTGTTYLIRVGGFGGATGNGVLSIQQSSPLGNDNCSIVGQVPPIVGDGLRFFSTVVATTPGAAPPNLTEVCGGNMTPFNNDVWYRYTASRTGNVTADLCNGFTVDGVLAVYSKPAVGFCPPAALIGCSDDSCGKQPSVTWAATSGTTYLIRIGAFGPNAIGDGILRITPPGPSNDLCANALNVPATGVYGFDTVGATMDAANGCAMDHDVWYTFTPAAAGQYEFSTCHTANSPTLDTRVAVYTGGCGALALVGCGDDECGTHARVVWTVADPGVGNPYPQYHLRLGGATGHYGMGAFLVSGPTAAGTPTNDECAGGLTVLDGANGFSSVGATSSAVAPASCQSVVPADNLDVWFMYTATGTANTNVTMNTCGSATFDTRLVAYNGTCAAIGGERACNDDGDFCAGLGSRINFAVTVGNTYLIRLSGFAGATGTGTLNIRPILNDRCAGAATLTQVDNGVTPFDSTGAADDVPAIALGGTCVGTIKSGLYYFYFASHTGMTRFSTCGSSFDTQIAIYNQVTCPANPVNQVGCNDNNAACGGTGLQSQVDVATVAGTGYLIHVGGSDVAAPGNPVWGPGMLTITPLGVGPGNDDCATAFSAPFNVPFPFTNVGATTDGTPHPTCLAFGSQDIFQDVWYTFSAPQTGTYIVDTCLGATFDTKIAVYPGCGPPLAAPIACNDDEPACTGNRSRLTFAGAAGTTYRIRVGSFANGAGNTGTGTLLISQASPADQCANFATAFDGSQPFTTIGATTDGPGDCAANQDIWYEYTATRTGKTRFSTCGSGYDTVISVYRSNGGVCPPVNLLACNDDAAACGALSLQSDALVPVTQGTRYTVRVGGYQTATGQGVLTIRPYCFADFNGTGFVSVQDLFDYLVAYFGNDLAADTGRNGAVELQDLFDFLAAYFAGCA